MQHRAFRPNPEYRLSWTGLGSLEEAAALTIALCFPGLVDEKILIPPDRAFGAEVLDTLLPAIEAAFGEGGVTAWTSSLTSTAYDDPAQHAAVLLHGLAANETWRRARAEPVAVTGYSLGIYAAAVGSGAISPVDAVRLVLAAGEGILRAQSAAGFVLMAITGLTAPQLREILESDGWGEDVEVTHYNSAIQHIVSASEDSLREIARDCTRRGALGVTILPFPGVVHRPDLAAFADDFYAIVEEIEVRPPGSRFYSPVTGGPVGTAEGLRAAIRDQLAAPVRLFETIHRMSDDGIREFVVLGPCAQLLATIRWLRPEAEVSQVPATAGEVRR